MADGSSEFEVTVEAVEAAIERMSTGYPPDEKAEAGPDPPVEPRVSQPNYADSHQAEFRREIADRIELHARQRESWAVRRPDHIDLTPRGQDHDADTGRRALAPDPGLANLGRYARRSRRYAGRSQQRVADEAGVSQSSVSRFERGVAPMLPVEKLLAIQRVYGRLFPLGVCPHEHECGWQPVRPPADPSEVATFIEFLLSGAAPAVDD